MRLSQTITVRIIGAICALLLLVPGSWAKAPTTSKSKPKSTASSTTKKSTTHKKTVSTKRSKRSKRVRKVRGQQVIDHDRTREIQAALIREHYMDGDPSGSWDPSTKAALAKYQRDNGWQTKIVPDSRALIKLGLGPSREGLLNPESAAMSSPHELGMETAIPGGATPHK